MVGQCNVFGYVKFLEKNQEENNYFSKQILIFLEKFSYF